MSDSQSAGVVFMCLGLLVDVVTGMFQVASNLAPSFGGYVVGYGVGICIIIIGLCILIPSSLIKK